MNYKLKSFKQLEFSNSYMFQLVMKDITIAKQVLETILGKKIRHISYHETEKTIETSPEAKGIRLDVMMEDDDTVYNIEMQTGHYEFIGKRSRYYQSSMDMNMLYKGMRYKDLCNTIIIFICLDDPFDKNLFRYTFTERCEEMPTFSFDTGTTKIFLNVAAAEKSGEAEDIISLLEYVHDPNKGHDNPLVDMINRKVAAER